MFGFNVLYCASAISGQGEDSVADAERGLEVIPQQLTSSEEVIASQDHSRESTIRYRCEEEEKEERKRKKDGNLRLGGRGG